MRKGLLSFYYSNLCQIGNIYHSTHKQKNYSNTVSKGADCLGTSVFDQLLLEPAAVHSISIRVMTQTNETKGGGGERGTKF